MEVDETFFLEEHEVPENEVLAVEGLDLDGDDPIEEQDTIDIWMTWKQTRTQINKEKTNRGFGSTGDLKKMEARAARKWDISAEIVQCGKVKEKDNLHLHPRSIIYVYVVKDEGKQPDDGDLQDEVVMILQSWDQRPRDYWWCDGSKVIREHVAPRSSIFCARWTGCPVPLQDIYDNRTTAMFCSDGSRMFQERSPRQVGGGSL